MEPGSSLPRLQEPALFWALGMYSELEEQEANSIKMYVAAPEQEDCVWVVKTQNILCQK